MSDSFDQRGKSLEDKHTFETARDFKAQAKAVKQFGLWAAAKMNLSGADADAYALEVLDADFEEPGIGDVIAKVHKDLTQKGVALSEHHLENEYNVHLQAVLKQMAQD